MVSPAAAPDVSDSGRAVTGTTGPDATHKRIGHVTRDARSGATTTTAATTATTTAPVAAGPMASSSYTFSTVLDGSPVRWDPCTPIRWTANLTGAPAGALDVLRGAVARVASVTGTTWHYVGASSATPSSAYLPRTAQDSYAPILIGWTDASRSDLLAGQRDTVLGMTKTSWFGVRTADGRSIAATRAAVVALDRTDKLPLTGARSWSAVALHELAHVMGLGHVSDSTQLMATILPAISDLQSGDRAGLVRVGRTAGCVTVPSA
jgi:hydroxyethylthiazole kinase-like sugar kinase family protein